MTRSAVKHVRVTTRRIEPRGVPVKPIRFGTSGWRGVLGEEVTFPRLRVLVRSVADWIRQEKNGDRVLIGWDGRFASEAMAEIAARILIDEGLRPVLANRITPTPAIARAVARGRCAAGLVLTASHNPPAYHGIKVFGPWGGSITDDHARRIEEIAARRARDDGPPRAQSVGRKMNFNVAYRRAIESHLDMEAFGRSRLRVVYDAMHGAGGGLLDSVLEAAGVRVDRLRCSRDPEFGGGAPDPVSERLSRLAEFTRSSPGLRLGLATDGDADRFGVVDGRGVVLTETQVIALLVDELAKTKKLKRGVAISAATGSIVERVAAEHGLPVQRFPIGFKSLSIAIHEGIADAAGEESGGFALASMGPDKDGILTGCLLANLVATSGRPLEDHIARLEARHGKSACARASVAASPALDKALDRLERNPPDRIGRSPVIDVDHRCGLRLELADRGFVMLRRSGTEPRLRIYAEASDDRALGRRLLQARRLIEREAKLD